MMPLEVIEEAQAELPDWKGGMSVMEVSHRGADFIACAAETERSLRELMQIPGNYKVLFLQGGGMGQFAAVPLNLASAGDSADYVLTGQWGTKALKEASRMGLLTTVVADEKNSKYTRVPAEGSFTTSPNAKYLHYTPNETIGGVEFGYIPQTGDVPLVADLSSTILSRPIDVAKFGVIYAGTQKNMGPAGMAVVIVRDDLLDRARPSTPSIWQYRAMADADSMLNTPPTFSIYLLGKILAWVEKNGGLAGMAERNQAKADLLYGFIDDSPFYSNPVEPSSRSWMNVPFLMTKPELNTQFVAEAAQAGLTNLGGHRSVGGMRASIYNAMPIEGVAALVEFMKEFERVHA
jgi:phosphoserine aminotransferase